MSSGSRLPSAVAGDRSATSVGVEIDGGYHRNPKQRRLDAIKERACEEAGITLVRITNDEVFGDREAKLKQIRDGMLRAVIRQRGDKPMKLQKRPAATKTTATH
jgi:hypothetical protein